MKTKHKTIPQIVFLFFLLLIPSALAIDDLSYFFYGLHEPDYVNDFFNDGGGDFDLALADQKQIQNYYAYLINPDETPFQEFSDLVVHTTAGTFDDLHSANSIVTTNKYSTDTGEQNVKIFAVDDDFDLMMLDYDEGTGAFIERTINLPSVFGIPNDFEGIYVADLTGDLRDEIILITPNNLYGLEYDSDSVYPYYTLAYNISWPFGETDDSAIDSLSISGADVHMVDIKEILGKVIITQSDIGAPDALYVYEVTQGSTPVLNLLFTSIQTVDGCSDYGRANIVSLTGLDTSVIMTCGNKFYIAGDEDDWFEAHTIAFTAPRSSSFHLMQLDNFASDFEIVVRSGGNYGVIDCPSITSCSALKAYGAVTDFTSKPFAVDVDSGNIGHEICSYYSDANVNFSVKCWNETSATPVYHEVVTIIDNGSVIAPSDADYDMYNNLLFHVETPIDVGALSIQRDLIVTPTFAFWVDSTGAWTTPDLLYTDDWIANAEIEVFFASWIDDSDKPDLIAYNNQLEDVYAKLNLDDPAEVNPFPIIETVGLVEDYACINDSDSLRFATVMENVPDEGYQIKISCNTTEGNFSTFPTLNILGFTITCNESLTYFQTTGTKVFSVQTRNSFTNQTSATHAVSYTLYDPYVCNQALLGINTSESGLIPTFTWSYYIPSSPVQSGTEINISYIIQDQDGGNFTFGFAQNILNTAIWSLDPDEVLDIFLHDSIQADQTFSKSEHNFTAESGGLDTMGIDKSITINAEGDYTLWTIATLIPDGFEYTNADYNIPLLVRAQLLAIDEADIINEDYTLPQWFQDRPWIQPVPIVICEDVTCFSVPTHNDTDDGSTTSQDGDGTPTGDGGSGTATDPTDIGEDDAINTAFDDVSSWTGLSKAVLWLIMMCIMATFIWMSGGQGPVNIGVITIVEILMIIIGVKIGMIGAGTLIVLTVGLLVVAGLFFRKIFFGGE